MLVEIRLTNLKKDTSKFKTSKVDSALTSNRLSTMTRKLIKSASCNGEPWFLSYDPVLRANLIAATFHS